MKCPVCYDLQADCECCEGKGKVCNICGQATEYEICDYCTDGAEFEKEIAAVRLHETADGQGNATSAPTT